VPDSKTLKLLLVEDSLEDEQLLREALLEIEENRQWCNWRACTLLAVDGLADALDCLGTDSFDAVLLNLSLPDSPAMLESFLDVRAAAGSVPILVLADEPDENLENRLLREGAQDVLLKPELECGPLARAIRYAIERQRRVNAVRVSAIVDDLTGALSREAFLKVAAQRSPGERLAWVEVGADREALDPLLMQTADSLRRALEAPAVLGRWDRRRFCILAPEAAVQRAAGQLTSDSLRFSFASFDEMTGCEPPLRAKIAMLAD